MSGAINEASRPRIEPFALSIVAPGALRRAVEEARETKGMTLARLVASWFDVIL